MNEIKCSLCDSSLIDRYIPSEVGNFVKCQRCGLVFLQTEEPYALKGLYSKDYFLERDNYFLKDGIIDGSGIESAHIKDFIEGLDWMESFQKPPGRILDLGCALGSFLSIAKSKGWECYGVEISEYAASIAKGKLGVEIFNGVIGDAPYPDNFFDAVTMWDVIEHLPDYKETIKEVQRVLKKDGILLVNTPNEGSFMRMMSRFLYKGSGGIIKLPVNRLYHYYHVVYFNEETLTLLFEKAGFSILAKKRKVIPITRGRGSTSVKAIVKVLSIIERLLHAEYELFFIVQKKV